MSAATVALFCSMILTISADAPDVGNRLAYLDEFCDPYYVDLHTPKLITPQWIGEDGVEAVIVLAIDDLRKAEQHEKFLRPIFERLKKIDGRAAVSIMTNQVDPKQPLVQKWLQEGVNLEAHTDEHPCPCLQLNDLAKARTVYQRNVDALAALANARPVAFRMPCCDSMNSVSPRFFTEIFNQRTPRGKFLSMDSSVFGLFTAGDPELPQKLVSEDDGRERFRKYVPTDRLMINLVEDYPYPYVIGRLCWEISPVMPSDWDAQHLNGKCSPATVRDWQAAVDAVVIKRGIFSVCFHAHNWIGNDQVVELIDYAVTKHGKKVKFLTFREVQERLDGHPLRAADGGDNGVRVLDVNNDGYMDVVVANDDERKTYVWLPETGTWHTTLFPFQIVAVNRSGRRHGYGVQFGVLEPNGSASVLKGRTLWRWAGRGWDATIYDPSELVVNGRPVHTCSPADDAGVRFRDLDRDGISELIVGNPGQNAVFQWERKQERWGWSRLPFALPEGTMIVDAQGRDAGLRFVDLDEDGHLDVVFSNAEGYSAHAFSSMTDGWSRTMLSGKRGDRKPEDEIPMIVRADGSNNGAWFKYRHMWVQNEDTGKKLPEHVESRHFTDDFLAGEKDPPARSP